MTEILTADSPPDDPRLTAAVQRVVAALQAVAPPDYTVSLVTWNLPEAGFRVAEVDWVRNDRKAGATFMQRDLPHGLAACAQAERAVITVAYMNDEDEAQQEIDALLSLVREDKPEPEPVPPNTYTVRQRTTVIEDTLYTITLPQPAESYISDDGPFMDLDDVLQGAVTGDIEGALVSIDWNEHKDDPAADYNEFSEGQVKP